MADTPTGDSKAKAEDTRPRANAGQDRDRRRGGRKGKGKQRSAEADAERSDANQRRRDKPRRDRDRDRRSEQPLTAGLFAGVADREMPCRVAGCPNTWTWFGTQQIRSLGKPPPKRMCAEHLAEFEGIEDRQMPCRNNWCPHTWTWTRAAQLYQRERQEKLKPPHRLCDQCFDAEKNLEDREVACKIQECKHTWTWTRDAQLRHRAWVGRQQAKHDAEEAQEVSEAEAPRDGEAVEAAIEPVASEAVEAASEAVAVEAVEAASEAVAVEAVETASDAAASEAVASEAASEAVEAASEAVEATSGAVEAASEAVASEQPHSAEPSEAVEGQASELEAASDDEHGEADGEHDEAGESDEQVEADGSPDEQDRPGKKRRRKRRRKRKVHDGPPEKLCERCFARLGHLEPIEIPCKVHGCTHTWTWERDGQLRAWAALDGQENVTELPQPPRRMCNSCFEFVRQHGDREVACGRPGCDKTWTYKTGAQLQDFLAGRTQDPIRLCEECSRSQFTIASSPGMEVPEGSEVMPCQVAGCSGSWVYVPGMQLSAADPDAAEPPVDRMCDDCRTQRGEPARDPRRVAAATADAAIESPA